MHQQTITAAQYNHFVKTGSLRAPKYGNVRTKYNSPLVGERNYDSKKEAEYAMHLDALVQQGVLKSWIPQVRFPIPAGSHIIDFLAIHPDDTYQLIEVKGRDVPHGKTKRAIVEKLYNVKVTVV